MDCQLFERQVQRGLDGLLAAHEQADVQKHAAVCPSCAALLEDMTAVDGLLHMRLSAVEAPEGFAEAVMSALPAPYAKPVLRLVLPRQRWLRFGSMAAAAALLVGIGIYGFLPSSPVADQTALGPVDISIAERLPEANNDPQPPQPANNYQLPARINSQQEPEPNPPGLGDVFSPQNSGQTEVNPQDDNPVAPPPQDPRVAEVEPPMPYSMPVGLSQPAYNPKSEGVLALTLLAAYEDCDAVLPSLNKEGLVEFYIRYKGLTHLWTQTLDAQEAPVYVGQVKAMPSLFEIMGSTDESAAAGFTQVSAVSPDGRLLALNRGGEAGGLWLYNNPPAPEVPPAEEPAEQGVSISGGLGGGKVLSWSPDGNKLLYTNAAGNLYVYYLAEDLPVPLYSGIVTCASWAGDSATVLFAGKENKEGRSAIYTIQVP